MTSSAPTLPPIDKARLIERFLQYVAIGTASDPNSQQVPSSRGQLLLGDLLARQLKELGAEDVQH
ncbi:MAG: peptidase T, partial [Pirellulaceae bacterium]